MSSFAAMLSTLFSAPISNPHLHLIRDLKTAHPGAQHASILQWADSGFPLSAYLATLDITPEIVEPDTHCLLQYNRTKHGVYSQVVAGASTFTYDATEFTAYKATWMMNHMTYVFYQLVFAGLTDSVGRKLAQEVYEWANALKEEIWVFEGGCWEKSTELYKAVHAADWEDIVLDTKFKEGLQRDTETFFSSKEIYASLGITWKRGILLLGPPGNGKTESIKAVLKDATCAVLYAKTFVTNRGAEEGVRAIFEHARKHSPCILVLEDLDAMVTDTVRSFFLNELDGLAQNDGILTIATTNHPERIDDAILNRPSRFDVKYTFELPPKELRKEFISLWIHKVHARMTATGVSFADPESVATSVAEKTEGWSFAFLKELFVSFLLRIAHDQALHHSNAEAPTKPFEEQLLAQVDQLAAQIIKSKDDIQVDKSGAAHPSMFRGARMATSMAMFNPGFENRFASASGPNF